MRQTTREIENIRIDNVTKNLRPEQILVLKSLTNYFGITIKESDKGGNVVLMDNEMYENMCLKILNDKKYLHPLLIGSIKISISWWMKHTVRLLFLKIYEILYVQNILVYPPCIHC